MATSDRKPYLTATVLDQDLLNEMQDNLEFNLEMIVEVQTPTGTIYASDRNKYVGSRFYRALLNFPEIFRTLGEWLTGELEFSALDLSLSNVDGRFNNFLPGGDDFAGWIGKSVTIKIGLRDVLSTYTTVFKGVITEVAGFGRNKSSVNFTARDQFDSLNVEYPPAVFTETTFPDIEPDKIGRGAPVIYGDWTVNLREFGSPTEQKASIPATPVNGLNVGVQAGTTPVSLVISDHDLTFFDTTKVYLLRNNEFWLFDSADIVVGAGNRSFTLKQGGSGGTTLVDTATYQYETGDEIFVRVKGKDLGSGGIYDQNVIEIARDILKTYGGAVSGDFDSNWNTFRVKASPAQSNINAFKFRLWRQEFESVLKEALSLLEQVRLEFFVNRELKLKVASLHFEDLESVPSSGFILRNWDVEVGTFSPQTDDRNQFNRAQADYDFDPSLDENRRNTAIHRNSASITQAGKEISKKVVFPNMHVESEVKLQLVEIIRLASAYPEMIPVILTPRAFLLDVGDFVLVDVKIGSTIYTEVPCMVRSLGYNPDGLRIPVKLWSFQMTPFPGYVPGFAGTVGGFNATITEET